jgi:hypothetical protein
MVLFSITYEYVDQAAMRQIEPFTGQFKIATLPKMKLL